MNPVSFMTANYVARQVGFQMTDWMHGQNAVDAFYRPMETYPERIEELCATVAGLGFDHLDLWLPHLHPDWATAEHISAARAALERHGLAVASLAGWFGADAAAFERCCKVANAVGAKILGGMAGIYAPGGGDRAAMQRLCEQYDCYMAIENHPEKTPAEVLEQIGDTCGGRLGTCVDTGIWAGKGYDPLRAIRELRSHVLYVHLKDEVPGQGSVSYGQGVVPLEACVRELVASGYTGGFSVEHEPRSSDPSADAQRSAELLRGWLGQG
jgi:sugar phosphate isomerase/epimerase